MDIGDDNDHKELKTNIPVVIPPHSSQFVGPGTSSSSLTKRRHFFHRDQSSENISSFLTLRGTSLPSWSPLPIKENEKGVWCALVLGMWFKKKKLSHFTSLPGSQFPRLSDVRLEHFYNFPLSPRSYERLTYCLLNHRSTLSNFLDLA